MTGRASSPPLIAHVIYRLDVGGLENGLVNIVNHLPEDRYRHAIICMTEYTDYAKRIRSRNVALRSLHKRPGKDLPLYGRLWRCLRELSPAIVHTRNLATLEAQAVAALAGVPGRVHGEHGWDVEDPHGSNSKNRRLRRLAKPFVHRYIALSGHIQDYLLNTVGVARDRVEQIPNGVDAQRFSPGGASDWVAGVFGPGEHWVIGTVGRLQPIKDQITLLRAFARMCNAREDIGRRARLVIVGDGPMQEELRDECKGLGLSDRCWFAGQRDDIPDLLRGMDLFVLPSLAEGICNTILEAMACGLPVVATAVGGNPELVSDGISGKLVEPGNVEAQAVAMTSYVADPARARRHGEEGRLIVERHFSLQAMVAAYASVYDRVLRPTVRRVANPGRGSPIRNENKGG